MGANDKCRVNEVLKEALPEHGQAIPDRIIVNEDYLQSMDDSDGATMYND